MLPAETRADEAVDFADWRRLDVEPQKDQPPPPPPPCTRCGIGIHVNGRIDPVDDGGGGGFERFPTGFTRAGGGGGMTPASRSSEDRSPCGSA